MVLQAGLQDLRQRQHALCATSAPWTQHGQRHARTWHAGPAGSRRCRQSMRAPVVLRLLSGSSSDRSSLHERWSIWGERTMMIVLLLIADAGYGVSFITHVSSLVNDTYIISAKCDAERLCAPQLYMLGCFLTASTLSIHASYDSNMPC